MLIASVVILAVFIRNQLRHQRDTATGKAVVQVVSGPAWRTFSSSFFEFRDYDNWVVDGTPTNNKVTYAIMSGSDVDQSFTVYLNQVPQPYDLESVRALPVSIINRESFNVAGAISGPCLASYSPNQPRNPMDIAIDGTTIFCRPDTTTFSVLVGAIGGNYNLPLKRSNGQMANYLIQYVNSSMNPDPSPFLRAMQNFKAL